METPVSEEDKNNVVSFNTGRELFDAKAAAKRVANMDRFIAIGEVDGVLQTVCTEGYTDDEYVIAVEKLAWYTKLEQFGIPLMEDVDE
jgi:hypothetical protein